MPTNQWLHCVLVLRIPYAEIIIKRHSGGSRVQIIVRLCSFWSGLHREVDYAELRVLASVTCSVIEIVLLHVCLSVRPSFCNTLEMRVNRGLIAEPI